MVLNFEQTKIKYCEETILKISINLDRKLHFLVDAIEF
jgi:hypothetical protein